MSRWLRTVLLIPVLLVASVGLASTRALAGQDGEAKPHGIRALPVPKTDKMSELPSPALPAEADGHTPKQILKVQERLKWDYDRLVNAFDWNGKDLTVWVSPSANSDERRAIASLADEVVIVVSRFSKQELDRLGDRLAQSDVDGRMVWGTGPRKDYSGIVVYVERDADEQSPAGKSLTYETTVQGVPTTVRVLPRPIAAD